MTLPFHVIYSLNDWNVTQSTETLTLVCKKGTTYEISLGSKVTWIWKALFTDVQGRNWKCTYVLMRRWSRTG